MNYHHPPRHLKRGHSGDELTRTRRARILTLVVVVAVGLFALPAQASSAAVVLTFQNLSGLPHKSPYSGSAESGLTISPTLGNWLAIVTVGNPRRC